MNAAVSKTVSGEIPPTRVRIPPPPLWSQKAWSATEMSTAAITPQTIQTEMKTLGRMPDSHAG